MGPAVELDDLYQWSLIGPETDQARDDRQWGRRWDTGLSSSLSGSSHMAERATGERNESLDASQRWHEPLPDDYRSFPSPAEVEVLVGETGGSGGDSEEEDDPWPKRINVLERGQLQLQRHLDEAMRAIPEMVVRALAAEQAVGAPQQLSKYKYTNSSSKNQPSVSIKSSTYIKPETHPNIFIHKLWFGLNKR
ncbi:UNVERIFIED_CONTAM: hypothetical protein K2H54_048598 [Gekko kuhli]